MNIRCTLLFLSYLASCSAQSLSSADQPKKVFCYFANWAHTRPEPYNFNPMNVDPFVCDVIIYAFADFGKGNELVPSDKKYDLDDRAMVKMTMLKRKNKNLKLLMGTGGWKTGTEGFARITATEENRQEFARNTIRYLRGYNFDGMDLNWQHPTVRDGGKPEDKKNYVLLAQTLREEFDKESAESTREKLMLTISIANQERFLPGYDISSFNTYMDYILVILYDYTFFAETASHNSPLYTGVSDNEYDYKSKSNINYTINFFKTLAEPRKLVLGIATFGRSFKLEDPDQHSIGSIADGPDAAGPYSKENGVLAYFEICNNVKNDNWTVVKGKPAGAVGPYAHKGNHWVGYDDVDMVKTKARYAIDNGLGGVMFWTIDFDDFLGTCHGTKFPLIRAAREELNTDGILVFPSSEGVFSGGDSEPKDMVNQSSMVRTPSPPQPALVQPAPQAPIRNSTPKRKCMSGPPKNKHGSDSCDPETTAGIESVATRLGGGGGGQPNVDDRNDVSGPQNMVGDLLTLIQRAGGLSSLCKLLREEKKKSNRRTSTWAKQDDDNSIILETKDMSPIMIVIQNSSINIKEFNVYTRP